MAEARESTVIGVFDEYRAAQDAIREMTEAGIGQEAVRYRSNMATGAAGRGAGAGTTQAEGGIKGFLHGIFGGGAEEKEEADYYAEAVRRGNTLVAVTAPPEKLDQAIEIMNRHGAIDIDERVEAYRQTGFQHYDPNARPYTYEEAALEREKFRAQARTIPVVQEEVKVGKRAVRKGGVRVYSHVVEEPISEQVRLREEHAKVERRPVDRPITPGDETMMREQAIEVTETVEEPVVSKSARVKEEIVVGKEETTRTEEVRETVRHTEVNVEPTAGTERVTGAQPLTGAGAAIEQFRRDYDQNFSKSGFSFERLRPAYQFGFEKARESRFRGKSWSEAKSDLERDFLSNHPESKWSDVEGAAFHGWNYGQGKT